ncbi:hypothetical protein H8959_007426 [Pygathrix nigripes]
MRLCVGIGILHLWESGRITERPSGSSAIPCGGCRKTRPQESGPCGQLVREPLAALTDSADPGEERGCNTPAGCRAQADASHTGRAEDRQPRGGNLVLCLLLEVSGKLQARQDHWVPVEQRPACSQTAVAPVAVVGTQGPALMALSPRHEWGWHKARSGGSRGSQEKGGGCELTAQALPCTALGHGPAVLASLTGTWWFHDPSQAHAPLGGRLARAPLWLACGDTWALLHVPTTATAGSEEAQPRPACVDLTSLRHPELLPMSGPGCPSPWRPSLQLPSLGSMRCLSPESGSLAHS